MDTYTLGNLIQLGAFIDVLRIHNAIALAVLKIRDIINTVKLVKLLKASLSYRYFSSLYSSLTFSIT